MAPKKSSDEMQQHHSVAGPIFLILFVIIVLVAGYALWSLNGASSSSAVVGGPTRIETNDAYHAVFLSNGQVYFSKVDNLNSTYVTLEEVYYLRVQRAIQPASPEAAGGPAQTSISLIKLGSEVHGPEDIMYVNRDHVLFVEPLKENSKVVEAIAEDKRSE